MEQSFLRNSHSLSQEISPILWDSKIHYRVHKSQSLVAILSQMHPVNIFPPFFPRSILISSHLCLRIPIGLLPSRFPSKILYALLIPPMRAVIFASFITIRSVPSNCCYNGYILGLSSMSMVRTIPSLSSRKRPFSRAGNLQAPSTTGIRIGNLQLLVKARYHGAKRIIKNINPDGKGKLKLSLCLIMHHYMKMD